MDIYKYIHFLSKWSSHIDFTLFCLNKDILFPEDHPQINTSGPVTFSYLPTPQMSDF